MRSCTNYKKIEIEWNIAGLFSMNQYFKLGFVYKIKSNNGTFFSVT